MSWITRQERIVLEKWLSQSTVGHLSTKSDGSILWVNAAFENIVGYASSELKDLNWKSLTVGDSDLEHDEEMVSAVMSGYRDSYQMRKSYRHKTGVPVPCQITVLRHPLENDTFLVSVIPEYGAYSVMIQEVEYIKVLLVKLASRPTGAEQVFDYCKEHPKTAGVVVVVFGALLFGDPFLELVSGVIKVFWG